ncbi:MAG: hypothetical protein M5R36_29390 [Deltaproteobacteria bacterium]|nr:hypothetical protein [Deltaproteobacteria bacterium]
MNAQLDDVEERLRAATAQGDQRGALALMQEKLNLKRTLEDAGSRATRN